MKILKNFKMIFLSIVIPCLNEEESLPFCLKKIFKVLKNEKLQNKSEVIVVDNGSTDNSVKIAKKYNTRVIYSEKGYGNALKKGIENAKGEYVAFADADDSYNFLELPKFIRKAKLGYEVIQGNRFKKYGGRIENHAMPFSHRYFGNPFLSFLTKKFFKIKFNDVFCGFRMFKKKNYNQNIYFSSGMEFAVEHLIKLAKSTNKNIEIPITLHKDKRLKSSSHLKTFSDGFKTLKFIIVHGIQIPSLVFATIFLFFSFKNGILNIIHFDNLNAKALYAVVFFLMGIQFIFFYFFSNLASQKLGFEKMGHLNLIYKYISFNKSLLSFLVIFTITSILLLLNHLNLIENFTINKFLIFFLFTTSIQCFVNILMISILEYFGDKKK
jgi:glycosyltransferase involved in cell wall biosynthesis